jgi:hypothetical protein
LDCPEVEIDYYSPFESIFTKNVWQVMLRDGNLSILRSPEPNRTISDLPTWVPDWRSHRVNRQYALSLFQYLQYRATGSSRLDAKLLDDFKTLRVSGIFWDNISQVQSADDAIDENQLTAILESVDESDGFYVPTNESLPQAFCRVVYLDTMAFKRNCGEITYSETRWQSSSYEELEEIAEYQFSEIEEEKNQYEYFIGSWKEFNESRMILVTKRGRIGMAANTIQDGDAIVMLLGGDVPFVLRAMENAGHYTLVADCYVHGFMDGEGLVEAREAVDPAWNVEDTSWLEELHEREPPFRCKSFIFTDFRA